MERALGRHDVFISYSSKDKPTADAVCAILERNNIRCWMAPRDIFPGEEWAGSIIGAINDARVFVLLFSSFSNASPQIKREVERAANRGLPILPFRIDETPPNPTLEFFISTPHWLDALSPPLEQHAERLAATVKRLLAPPVDAITGEGGGAAPSPAPAPALPTPEPALPPPPPPPPRRPSPWLIAACVVLAILAVRFIPWRKSDPPPPEPPGPSKTVVPDTPPPASARETPTTTLGGPTGDFVVYIEAAPGAFYSPVETMALAAQTSEALAQKFRGVEIWKPEARPDGGYRIRASNVLMTSPEAAAFCIRFEQDAEYKGRLACRTAYEVRQGSRAAAVVRGE
jgi:hypothetical protein